jgi:hypothetical protein
MPILRFSCELRAIIAGLIRLSGDTLYYKQRRDGEGSRGHGFPELCALSLNRRMHRIYAGRYFCQRI